MQAKRLHGMGRNRLLNVREIRLSLSIALFFVGCYATSASPRASRTTTFPRVKSTRSCFLLSFSCVLFYTNISIFACKPWTTQLRDFHQYRENIFFIAMITWLFLVHIYTYTLASVANEFSVRKFSFYVYECKLRLSKYISSVYRAFSDSNTSLQ